MPDNSESLSALFLTTVFILLIKGSLFILFITIFATFILFCSTSSTSSSDSLLSNLISTFKIIFSRNK